MIRQKIYRIRRTKRKYKLRRKDKLRGRGFGSTLKW